MIKKVIIDTDCGVDDALALLYALHSDKLDVQAVTTVFGNTSAEQAAYNASHILRLADMENVPIFIGQEKPINQPLKYAPEFIHGKHGLGNIHATYSSKKLHKTSAVEHLIQTIRGSSDKITIIPIGPLTNIALALQIAPDIQNNIEEIIIMGGAYRENGNVTPAAEANIHNDAIAAEIVFSSECPTTMVGLDVTSKVIMDRNYLTDLCNHEKYGCFIKSITETYYNFHVKYFNVDGLFPHDLVTVIYAADKSFYKTIEGRVYVTTEGRMKGQTVIDRREIFISGTEWDNRKKSNICTEVDSDKLLSEFKTVLS